MVGGFWNSANQTATAAKGEKFDTPAVSQTFAGYNKSAHDRLNGSPYKNVKYLRKLSNAFYTNAGFTGGRTKLPARDITYGYYQENGKVQVITDRTINTGLESGDVSGFSVVRDLNVDTNAEFAGNPARITTLLTRSAANRYSAGSAITPTFTSELKRKATGTTQGYLLPTLRAKTFLPRLR